MISFEWWNLIPIGLAIVSLCFNFIQYRSRKNVLKPISSTIIGLFNDVKNKNLICFIKLNGLWNPENPHKGIKTMRLDFSDFINFMNQSLFGFQEHLVALLNGIGVKSKDVFKALDFGLTQDDKKFRELFYKVRKEQLEKTPSVRKKEVDLKEKLND